MLEGRWSLCIYRTSHITRSPDHTSPDHPITHYPLPITHHTSKIRS